MNLFDLLANFWRVDEQKNFSGNETLTHGTTNFTLDTLSSEDFYGGMIGDRLRMMFNFITMKGESRRC